MIFLILFNTDFLFAHASSDKHQLGTPKVYFSELSVSHIKKLETQTHYLQYYKIRA
jgi:hypothetical protein